MSQTNPPYSADGLASPRTNWLPTGFRLSRQRPDSFGLPPKHMLDLASHRVKGDQWSCALKLAWYRDLIWDDLLFPTKSELRSDSG
jgi:hypothetical protein